MSDSDSESDQHRGSDDEGKSSGASKQVLKPIPSMEDMLYPLANTSKGSLGKTGKKATKLSDLMHRPTATIVISTRRRPDMLNATRKYDRKKKKLVVEIPTKEVKNVTIQREVKSDDVTDLTGSGPSRKRQRSPSPVRTDTQRAEDYAEEICDKCDDFQEQVRDLAERGYYRDFQTDDDCKVMQAILTLMDRAIANNNRNLNELKALSAQERAKEPASPKSDDKPSKKRQKRSDKSDSKSRQDKADEGKGKGSNKQTKQAKPKAKAKAKASKMKE